MEAASRNTIAVIGTGDVAKATFPHLITAGYDIRATVRKPENIPCLQEQFPAVEFYVADVLDQHSLAEPMREALGVMFFATLFAQGNNFNTWRTNL